MPKVTVIVPNYNHVKYLRQRIESILNQTFQDFELILLDDCSTDGSREILNSYANHPKLKQLIFNTTNSGSTFKQWKKGIELAQGEYIWIAESDDFADLNFLEVLLVCITSSRDTTLAYSASNLVDKDGSLLGSTYSYTTTLDKNRWLNNFENEGKLECFKYLFYQNTIPNASAVLFSKKKYLQTSGGDPNYRLCGDWKLWFEMLMLEGNIHYVSDTLNNFRQLDSAQKKYNTIFKLEAIKMMLFVYSYNQIKNFKEHKLAVLKRIFGWCFLKGGGVLKVDSEFEVTISNLKLFFSLPFQIQSYLPIHILNESLFYIKYNLKRFLNRIS
jgi:glycosyltransferase involved in cell wall biosynthesis